MIPYPTRYFILNKICPQNTRFTSRVMRKTLVYFTTDICPLHLQKVHSALGHPKTCYSQHQCQRKGSFCHFHDILHFFAQGSSKFSPKVETAIFIDHETSFLPLNFQDTKQLFSGLKMKLCHDLLDQKRQTHRRWNFIKSFEST